MHTERRRAAVVGLGAIATEHLAFLTDSTLVELVGVCDISPATAQFTAERFRAPWFTDASEMLSDLRPDVVHVLTPPWTHETVVRTSLAAHADVIVEKPVATNSEELHGLLTAAHTLGRDITEDHNYLFNDEVLELRRLVDSGALGEVRDVDVRVALAVTDGGIFADPHLPHGIHSMPAGVIHDLLTHMCYLALAFVPGPFDDVTARWSNTSANPVFPVDDLDAILIADRHHVRLRFSSSTLPESFAIVVRGTAGSAEAELFQMTHSAEIRRPVGKQLTPLANQLINGVEEAGRSIRNFANKITKLNTPYHGLHRFLKATYGAWATGAPLPVGATQMIRTTSLIDRLVEQRSRP